MLGYQGWTETSLVNPPIHPVRYPVSLRGKYQYLRAYRNVMSAPRMLGFSVVRVLTLVLSWSLHWCSAIEVGPKSRMYTLLQCYFFLLFDKGKFFHPKIFRLRRAKKHLKKISPAAGFYGLILTAM